ncbi:hypothetical protein [Alcaligenes faecalis]|uniref:hypothetical protein n=1 Tax=Alcaligenes faecalis TaxID=511 RepID=UPI001EE439B1|nr:hypothetical protein [Alcaligenes faecalis]
MKQHHVFRSQRTGQNGIRVFARDILQIVAQLFPQHQWPGAQGKRGRGLGGHDQMSLRQYQYRPCSKRSHVGRAIAFTWFMK